MKLKFKYISAERKIFSDSFAPYLRRECWDVCGLVENGGKVEFSISYIQNIDERATHLTGKNVTAEMKGNSLIILEKEFMEYKKEWPV
jgi:hypothetical protein